MPTTASPRCSPSGRRQKAWRSGWTGRCASTRLQDVGNGRVGSTERPLAVCTPGCARSTAGASSTLVVSPTGTGAARSRRAMQSLRHAAMIGASIRLTRTPARWATSCEPGPGRDGSRLRQPTASRVMNSRLRTRRGIPARRSSTENALRFALACARSAAVHAENGACQGANPYQGLRRPRCPTSRTRPTWSGSSGAFSRRQKQRSYGSSPSHWSPGHWSRRFPIPHSQGSRTRATGHEYHATRGNTHGGFRPACRPIPELRRSSIRKAKLSSCRRSNMPDPTADPARDPARRRNDCPWCQREPAAADGGPGPTCARWRERSIERERPGAECPRTQK